MVFPSCPLGAHLGRLCAPWVRYAQAISQASGLSADKGYRCWNKQEACQKTAEDLRWCYLLRYGAEIGGRTQDRSFWTALILSTVNTLAGTPLTPLTPL